MGEAFSPNGIPGHFCQGGRPWLLDFQMGCKAPPRITQRGASNVHFSVEESAISLPDWRSHFSDRLGAQKTVLDAISDPAVLLPVVQAAVIPGWEGEESAADIVQMILEMRYASGLTALPA